MLSRVTMSEPPFKCISALWFVCFHVLPADASQTFLCWSITWGYWNSCPTGRCPLRVPPQVITSPWRNTGLILRTVEILGFFLSPHKIIEHIFFYSSPKFFCSNGLLKEVSEVNKMNDSLQSELQVGSGGDWDYVWRFHFTHLFPVC